MQDQTWPPPATADKPEPPKRSNEKVMDLFAGLCIIAIMLWLVSFLVIAKATTLASIVAGSNRHAVIEKRKWDKADPNWQKHWGEGPPMKLGPVDKFIVHWTGGAR